jgi:hypothetical protein
MKNRSIGFARLRNLWIIAFTLLFSLTPLYSQTNPAFEYLWYEAENMRGFTTGKLGAPTLNPAYLNLSRDKAPGWGMNGPGVSAEWTQGGESEWNSAAASADETKATIYQDLEVPRAGEYSLWVRYADWVGKDEDFTMTIAQDNVTVLRREFGQGDIVDPHDVEEGTSTRFYQHRESRHRAPTRRLLPAH